MAAQLRLVQDRRALLDAVNPPSSREAAGKLLDIVRTGRSSEGFASLPTEKQEAIEDLMAQLELLQQLNSCSDHLLNEAEDVLQPQPPQQKPGAEYLEARLRRAAAVPPEQRDPDVAAFVESAQLCREVCELLPLAPSGRPSLPSLEADRVIAAVELASAKLWWAMYVCPYQCSPAGASDPWAAMAAYVVHRTANTDFALLEPIMFGGSRSPASGSSSGGTPGAAASSSAAELISRVPASSALRLALLCASWGHTTLNFTIVKARLLRAAIEIASKPENAAAMDGRLAELAASQPGQSSPLRLTAAQLCCACGVCLVYVHIDKPEVPPPNDANQQLPVSQLSPAEVQAELQAVQVGLAALQRLEPQTPRTLLHLVGHDFCQRRKAWMQSVEHCLQCLQAARQQGSRINQVHASTKALIVTMLLLGGSSARISAGDEGGSGGSGPEDSPGVTRGSKPSGAGAGAARRQERRAAKQFEELQQAAAAAVAAAPSLPMATIETVLEAFRQGGELLKSCKQLLPEAWVRKTATPRKGWCSLEPAVAAHLEEARRTGSSTVTAARRDSVALAPAMEAAVRSGNWSSILQVVQEFSLELKTVSGFLKSCAFSEPRNPSLNPTCSGCGAVAVGLRKCAACKRAQYCSTECQRRHWPSHRAECRAAVAAGGSGSRNG